MHYLLLSLPLLATCCFYLKKLPCLKNNSKEITISQELSERAIDSHDSDTTSGPSQQLNTQESEPSPLPLSPNTKFNLTISTGTSGDDDEEVKLLQEKYAELKKTINDLYKNRPERRSSPRKSPIALCPEIINISRLGGKDND